MEELRKPVCLNKRWILVLIRTELYKSVIRIFYSAFFATQDVMVVLANAGLRLKKTDIFNLYCNLECVIK